MRNIFTVETLKLFASCITRFSHAFQHSSQASQHSSRAWNFILRALCSLMRDVLRLVFDVAKLLSYCQELTVRAPVLARARMVYAVNFLPLNLCDCMVLNI